MFKERRVLAVWAEKVGVKHYHENTIQLNVLSQRIKLWMKNKKNNKKKKLTDVYESSMTSRDEGGEEFCRLQCVRLGLAALCYALHVFSNVVHVGDIRPLLRVGVDAHIYQVPQLL